MKKCRMNNADNYRICLGDIKVNSIWSSMDEFRNSWKKECLLTSSKIGALSSWKDISNGIKKKNLSASDPRKETIFLLQDFILTIIKSSY